MVYRAVIALGRALFRALWLRRSVSGEEHLPPDGGAVIAISHFGYLDFAVTEWLVWTRRRRLVRFLATSASFRHPVSGPVMRAMGHLPVGPGAGALAAAVRALRSGELVGVFPEGRVSETFTLLPLRTGAAAMAAQAQVPLVPVVVWGSHRVLTRTHRPSLREAFGVPVRIVVGEPLRPARGSDPVAVTAELRATMQRLLARAQADYPSAPGAWWQPAHLGGGAPPDDAGRKATA